MKNFEFSLIKLLGCIIVIVVIFYFLTVVYKAPNGASKTLTPTIAIPFQNLKMK